MQRILLVEDEQEIREKLSLLLRSEGFSVAAADSQAAASEQLAKDRFDLALVDIYLPDSSGFAVCTAIKQAQDIPVLFLTAAGDEASVVTGLQMGADDYIIKPFRPRELIARIQAALRKSGRSPAVFALDGLQVDTASGIVRRDGRELFLSALEYRLLLAFIGSPHRILTRGALLDELWDASGEFVSDNTLTVYIKRLREKIEENPADPRIILTVRGIGYRLGDGQDAQ